MQKKYKNLFVENIEKVSLIQKQVINKQSELDRRHQSAFLKKRFCIHHVPPARAADKKIQPT